MGADVDSTFRLGGGNRPALALAVERGYAKLVDLMCQRHCSVQAEDRDGRLPLHLAALYGYIDVARILLDCRTPVNARAKDTGETALHIAASHNHEEMVDFLLSRGADINIQCKDGRTPLMYAAANNNRNCVEVLVAAGANIRLQDRKGNTALLLHTASAWANPQVVQLLAGGHNANISAVSATVRIPNYSGSYPILEVMKSTSNNRDEVLSVLVRKGSPLNVTTSEGSTPLHLACCSSAWSSALFLVRAGCRLDMEDILGRSVLYIALQNGQQRLAECMLAAGATISSYCISKLGAETQLYLKKHAREVGSLKYCVRKYLRQSWGDRVTPNLSEACLPVQLKLYVQYLIE